MAEMHDLWPTWQALIAYPVEDESEELLFAVESNESSLCTSMMFLELEELRLPRKSLDHQSTTDILLRREIEVLLPPGRSDVVNGILEGGQGCLRCVSAIAERSGPSLEALSQKRHPEDSQFLESPTAKLDFLGLFGLETQRPLARMRALSSPEPYLEMT